jgi:large conductance mechanosensitive channel
VIISAVIYYLVVAPAGRMIAISQRNKDATERECPECLSQIPVAARKCSFCTSEVPPAGQVSEPTPAS